MEFLTQNKLAGMQSPWMSRAVHCLIVLLGVVSVTAPSIRADYSGVILNELMAVNDSTIEDEFGENDDWIEITNVGSSAVNLMGLTLTDDLANPQAFQFPNISINPNSYLIIWADDTPDQGALHAAFKLTSAGEPVYLLDGTDIVDSTSFPALGADLSWGRWPDGTGDWKILGDASPGAQNTDPTPPDVAVSLNEVMADNYSTMEDPQEAGEFPDWIEIYNDEAFTVDLGGMFLTDDPSEPNMFEIPSGIMIPPYGFVVFIADDEVDQGSMHTNFKLGSSGDSVYLLSGGFMLDETTFGTLGSDQSWGRMPDGNGNWKHLGAATPGERNQDPQFAGIALYINEFMSDNTLTIEDPDEPGQYPDWVELFNAESEPLDLGGMYLSDEAADPTKYPIPQGVSIPANGYLVFWADDETDQGPLHTNFKLAQSGEILQLYHSDGITQIDFIEFGAQQTDVSFGRYPDGTDNWGFHSDTTPGSANVPESAIGMVLFMDDRALSNGDRFNLYFTLWPESATQAVDAYILLGIHGLYWSWPQWNTIDQGLSKKSYTLYPGNQVSETVLDFVWPSVEGVGTGLTLYGMTMKQGTFDPVGNLQVIDFVYE